MRKVRHSHLLRPAPVINTHHTKHSSVSGLLHCAYLRTFESQNTIRTIQTTGNDHDDAKVLHIYRKQTSPRPQPWSLAALRASSALSNRNVMTCDLMAPGPELVMAIRSAAFCFVFSPFDKFVKVYSTYPEHAVGKANNGCGREEQRIVCDYPQHHTLSYRVVHCAAKAAYLGGSVPDRA